MTHEPMPPYDTLFSVADQTVFVVGASRGIGRAIAAGFASRSARVVIAGRDESTITATATELSVGARHEVEGVVCDTADRARVIEVVDDLVERHGGIDTLVLQWLASTAASRRSRLPPRITRQWSGSTWTEPSRWLRPSVGTWCRAGSG
ncbi:MAG: SDR family NAD(P)-dependent oxidoreductase [Pirellulaceae bacterium]